jgi:hypothetical protein
VFYIWHSAKSGLGQPALLESDPWIAQRHMRGEGFVAAVVFVQHHFLGPRRFYRVAQLCWDVLLVYWFSRPGHEATRRDLRVERPHVAPNRRALPLFATNVQEALLQALAILLLLILALTRVLCSGCASLSTDYLN